MKNLEDVLKWLTNFIMVDFSWILEVE